MLNCRDERDDDEMDQLIEGSMETLSHAPVDLSALLSVDTTSSRDMESE